MGGSWQHQNLVEAVHRHCCVRKNGLIHHGHVRFHLTKSAYLPLHTFTHPKYPDNSSMVWPMNGYKLDSLALENAGKFTSTVDYH